MDVNSKRIRITLKTSNPLFKQWLKELIDEATRKKKKISKTYQKALDNLEKYPLTLHSGHDCAILEGFGPKICELLENKLQEHLAKSNDPKLKDKCFKDKLIELKNRESIELTEFIKDIEASYLTDESLNDKTRKSLKNNENINLSIIEEEEDVQMKSDSLIPLENENKSVEINQNVDADLEELEDMLSDKENSNDDEDSFDRLVKKYCPKMDKKKDLPKPDFRTPVKGAENKVLKKFKSFNAVSSVAGPSYASSPILSKFHNVDKMRTDIPTKIPEDYDEFDLLVNSFKEIDVLPSPILPKKKSTKQVKTNQALPLIRQLSTEINTEEKEKDTGFEYITVDDINPLDFEVILLIDIGESKTVSTEIKSKLQEHGVKSDVRKLHVGDFLWIIKHRTQKNAKEYALPYIVERKRLDDLSSSIKDGRFHEQKFRLKKSGIENVIYLIENYMKGGKVQSSLPFQTLLQAAANTQIHSEFQVKFTESCDHTGLYLAVMSSFIENIFKNKKPLKYKLLEFETFNQSSVKQRKLTVRETFIKQLLSLKGLSVDIALEITKFYPTPSHLFNTYKSLSKAEGELLLSKITIGELKRKIPSPISRTIYHYYMYE